jgi:predicted ferric reductase
MTATLREMTYPQIRPFARFPFFDLPPLGKVYIVTLYIVLILVLLFRDSIVPGPMYYETIAYRAAWVSVGQVPLVILLAMKNSIVGFLIGSSHERLNWLHRTVARCLLFTVTIHFGFFWREWWVYQAITSELKMMTVVKFGLASWFVLIWIVISSFAPIRNLRYEIFVAQHIISFIALITCIMLHVPRYASVYIWIAIGFYAFDRTVRTARLIYHNLAIFHPKSPSKLFSCKAHLTALPGHATRITIPNPPFRTWSPGQHVFLSIPSIAPFQSHPFTIASAPSAPVKELVFVVRAHSGFSRRLYDCATRLLPRTAAPSAENPYTAILDGPYGCPPNFLQYDTLVLIAGSTGCTFTISILRHTLHSASSHGVRRIQFMGCRFRMVQRGDPPCA